MEYRPEYSKPRYRRLCFYCERCHAFRYTIEVQEKNILTWIFNSLNPPEIVSNRQIER
jgi:hypothetical protein